jgi:malonate decarboxylase beta subunit
MIPPIRISFLEATARKRLAGIVDPGSFREILPPQARRVSPHLGHFNAPVAFDDGAIIGEAAVNGQPVYIFAQEGKFRGGSLGEVHAAKITGLLERAAERKPAAVIGLFDSGGVRLEEANAGEIGSTEIMRAIFEAQAAGVPVIGLIGGSCGCFGGASIIASCCDALVASEEGRLSVSGPEVIETVMGVEAFDSRDRALVWRTTGGKNRFLFGKVARLVDDHIPAFRDAVATLIQPHAAATTESLRAERARLQDRLEKFGKARDAREIWTQMGLDAAQVPEMTAGELTLAAAKLAQ